MLKRLALLLLLPVSLAAKAQPFRNLNFEEANTNGADFFVGNSFEGRTVVYGLGPTEDLIPGWQLFKGSDLFLRIGINAESVLAGSAVNLISPSFFEGNYGLDFGFNAENQPWSLVQRGDVPADAAYLAFNTGPFNPFATRPQPTLNGEGLPIVFSNSGRLLFDASAFAGQNAELRFTFDVNTGPRSLDDIQFLVPEPGPVSLAVLGLVVLTSWKLARKSRRSPTTSEANACSWSPTKAKSSSDP